MRLFSAENAVVQLAPGKAQLIAKLAIFLFDVFDASAVARKALHGFVPRLTAKLGNLVQQLVSALKRLTLGFFQLVALFGFLNRLNELFAAFGNLLFKLGQSAAAVVAAAADGCVQLLLRLGVGNALLPCLNNGCDALFQIGAAADGKLALTDKRRALKNISRNAHQRFANSGGGNVPCGSSRAGNRCLKVSHWGICLALTGQGYSLPFVKNVHSAAHGSAAPRSVF